MYETSWSRTEHTIGVCGWSRFDGGLIRWKCQDNNKNNAIFVYSYVKATIASFVVGGSLHDSITRLRLLQEDNERVNGDAMHCIFDAGWIPDGASLFRSLTLQRRLLSWRKSAVFRDEAAFAHERPCSPLRSLMDRAKNTWLARIQAIPLEQLWRSPLYSCFTYWESTLNSKQLERQTASDERLLRWRGL